MVGAERLLFGTDYPYDMGESDPLGMLERAGLGSRAELLGDTAAELLGQRTATA
jgi:aminocarboxymuconate-semialdehyde decarboxylase